MSGLFGFMKKGEGDGQESQSQLKSNIEEVAAAHNLVVDLSRGEPLLESFGNLIADGFFVPTVFFSDAEGKVLWERMDYAFELDELRSEILEQLPSAASGEVVKVSNPVELPEGKEDFPQDGIARTAAWVPLKNRDNIIGYLCIVDDAIRELTLGEDNQLRSFASLLVDQAQAQQLTDQLTMREGLVQEIEEFMRLKAGDSFLALLVKKLSEMTGADFAFVAKCPRSNPDTARALAVNQGGASVEPFDYPVLTSPFNGVNTSRFIAETSALQSRYPLDEKVTELGLESFAGISLTNPSGKVNGFIALMSKNIIEDLTAVEALLQAVASRVSVEIEASARRQETSEALESSKQLFDTLFEGTSAPICMKNVRGQVTKSNEAFRTLVGYSTEELSKKTLADLNAPQFVNEELAMLQEFSQGKHTSLVKEKSFLKQDGTVISCRSTFTSVPAVGGGIPELFIETVEDLSSQSANQESATQASHEAKIASERFSALFDPAPLGIIHLNADGSIQKANKSLYTLLRVSEGELRGRSIQDLDPTTSELPEVRECLSGAKTYHQCHSSLQRKDSSTVEVKLTFSGTRLTSGEVDSITVYVEDKSNEAEQAVAAAEQNTRFKALFNSTSVGIAITDERGHLTETNHTLQEILKTTADELKFKTIQEISFDNDPNEEASLDPTKVTPESPAEIEKHLKDSEGNLVWCRATFAYIPGETKGAYCAVYLIENLTPLLLSESLFLEVDSSFTRIMETAPFGLATTNSKAYLEKANLALTEMLGFNNESLQSKVIADLVYPEDRDKYIELQNAIIQGERDQFRMDTYLLTSDENNMHANLTVSAVKPNGTLHHFLVMVEDTSTEKERTAQLESAERALKNSQDQLNLILSESPVGTSLLDTQGSITTSNIAFAEALGSLPEIIKNKTLTELLPDDEVVDTGLTETLEWKRDRFQKEFQVEDAGTPQTLRLTLCGIFDSSRRGTGFFAAVENITAAKNAQVAAKGNTEPVTELLTTCNIALIEIDEKRVIINSKGAAKKNLFITAPPNGKPVSDFFRDSCAEDLDKLFDKALKNPDQTFQDEFPLKSGGIAEKWVRLSVHAVAGQSENLHIFVEDVSLRRSAEERATHNADQLEAIFRHPELPLAILDSKGNITRSNTPLQKLTGIGGEELRFRKITDLIDSKTTSEVEAGLGRLHSGERQVLHYKVKVDRGNGKNASSGLTVSRAGQGDEASCLVAVLQDYDARDEAGREVHAPSFYQERYESVFVRSGVAMVTLDVEGKILESNDTLDDWLESPTGNLISKDFKELISENEREEFNSSLESVLSGDLTHNRISSSLKGGLEKSLPIKVTLLGLTSDDDTAKCLLTMENTSTLEEARSSTNELKAQLAKEQEETAKAAKKEEALKADLKSETSKIIAVEEVLQQVRQELIESQSQLDARKIDLEEQKEKLSKDIKQAQAQLKEVKEKNKTLDKEHEDLQSKFNKSQKELNELKAKNQELEGQQKENEAAAEGRESELQAKLEKSQTIEKEKNELQLQLEESKTLESEKSEELEALKSKEAETQSQFSKLSEQHKELQKDLSETCSQLEAVLNELASHREAKESAQQTIEELRGELTTATSNAKSNQASFDAFFKGIPAAVVTVDKEGLILQSNPSAEDFLTPFQSADEQAANLVALFKEEDSKKVSKALHETSEEGTLLRVEATLESNLNSQSEEGDLEKSGTVPVRLILRRINEDKEEPHCLVMLENRSNEVEATSRLKELESELAEASKNPKADPMTEDILNQSRYFRALFRSPQLAVAMTDTEGNFVNVNTYFEGLTGYSRKELRDMDWSILNPEEDDNPDTQLSLELLQASINPLVYQKFVSRKNETLVWVRITATAIINSDDTLSGVILTMQNLSEQKLSEDALSEFQITCNTTGLGLMVMNMEDRRLMRVNNAIADILGYTRDEMLELDIADLSHPHDFTAETKLLDEMAAGERIRYRVEKRFISADDQTVWAKVRASYVEKEHFPSVVVWLINDITHHKMEEEEMEELNERSAESPENESPSKSESQLLRAKMFVPPPGVASPSSTPAQVEEAPRNRSVIAKQETTKIKYPHTKGLPTNAPTAVPVVDVDDKDISEQTEAPVVEKTEAQPSSPKLEAEETPEPREAPLPPASVVSPTTPTQEDISFAETRKIYYPGITTKPEDPPATNTPSPTSASEETPTSEDEDPNILTFKNIQKLEPLAAQEKAPTLKTPSPAPPVTKEVEPPAPSADKPMATHPAGIPSPDLASTRPMRPLPHLAAQNPEAPHASETSAEEIIESAPPPPPPVASPKLQGMTPSNPFVSGLPKPKSPPPPASSEGSFLGPPVASNEGDSVSEEPAAGKIPMPSVDTQASETGPEQEQSTESPSIATGLLAIDKSGRIMMVSPVAEQLLRQPMNQLYSQYLTEVLDVSSREEIGSVNGPEGSVTVIQSTLNVSGTEAQVIQLTTGVHHSDAGRVGMLVLLSPAEGDQQPSIDNISNVLNERYTEISEAMLATANFIDENGWDFSIDIAEGEVQKLGIR